LNDAALLGLTAKTQVEIRADWGPENAAAGALSLVLNNGRTLRCTVLHALGDPRRPLDDTALHAKFMDCAARAAIPMTRVAADRLAQRIMDLEQEPDIGAVLSA
jgi:hypothetical protein